MKTARPAPATQRRLPPAGPRTLEVARRSSATFLVGLDFFVVNVSIPSIRAICMPPLPKCSW
jgi:hypothetical protein